MFLLYLKALEIQGFKSFSQKTRLTFEKPVTAIVGPNGSGKSNISDAIRWVMGEQSTKALRSGKMEDVIFGGTSRRGPMGFAEVSLILDNSGHLFNMENSEVMITRRFYRSGDSEYYINRQSVRLRDVHELLMDTGLGREGYSIIGQGRIDEIISIKSSDRREIFEEAAGISRFRHRKEEAEHKIEKSEENLLRVNDKIAELELQVEPLRRQSETAKKYLVLRDELRSLEISVWTETLCSLALQSKQLEESCEQSKKELDRAHEALDRFYAEGETFGERMRGKDMEAERVREQITAAEARAADTDSAAAVLRANLSSNLESIQRIDGELKQQEGRDSSLSAQIEERHARIAEIDAIRAALKEKAESAAVQADELARNSGETSDMLSALIRSQNDNAVALAEKRTERSSLAVALQEAEDRSAAIISETGEAEARLEEAVKDSKGNDKKLLEARERADSLRNMISGYTLRAENRRKKAEIAGDKRTKLTMTLSALRSRIALLSEMEKEYAGYNKAVKTIMQESSRGILKNVYGPVADLIKTEDAYTVAVETALGGAMQNIIVGTEEDGKAAINLLKRRDEGRATFLPVSAIRGSRLSERSLEAEEGFKGLAIDLVRFDEKYRDIYTNILGRIAIVDDMDSAIRIAKKYGYRFRLVTMDGQVINSGGSMTGGSASRNAGILSRANEIKKLSEREGVLASDARDAERALEAATRDLEAAEYELKVSRDELRPLEDEMLKLESAQNHFALIIDAAGKAVETLRAEAASVRGKIEKTDAGINAVRAEIERCEKLAEEMVSDIVKKTEGRDELAGESRRLSEELSALREQDASLAAECETLKRAAEELFALRADLSGGREQQTALIEDYKARNDTLLNEIAEKDKISSIILAEIGKYRTRIVRITEEKMALEAERTRRDRMTQEKNREILDLERESARLEQKKLAQELEEKQIVDKLWDAYELSRTTAMEIRQEVTNMAAAGRRIAELKREISRLGTPNIGAIEEFERVNTRYTYLTDQRSDIEKAKRELDGIINEITAEMKTIFTEQFGLIGESFKETFTELFGGGKAALELDDPEDILNCGIEIKVQPPGKSLKTITLLSGGEKAFVAIALYFAIIKVRPTPFVVMDEIETALDEANVIRFSTYMRRMTDRTQFLVITHRRSTMEEADVLYGVTMQEQGVSQVLSIDMVEAEKTIAK
ncbi:MAG: chromosome segregation protein SMC [Oscillospiraceae bacterium]